ncbi:MAG: protein kinase [Phycisphaerales bacterium]|nr:protein kinase [Phycisphaerales bacterium]
MPDDRDDNLTPPSGTPEDDQPTVQDDSSSSAGQDSADLVRGIADTPTVIMQPGEQPRELIGQTIEGFTITRMIGAGGMGAVYEAHQEHPRRSVALKVIRPGLASPALLRRFQYEAEALAKLQHIGIARIYAAGTWDDGSGATPWFAMEYIADAELLTSYARKRSLSIADRITLFRKVCDAVHHGHQKGIIHRDLKPGNILVDANGQPKIIDFGVARSVDSDLTVTTIQTDAGALIGTLQYMSPEQAKANPDEIDIRTDVYALGVILYELLCDDLPYNVRQLAIHEAVRVVIDEDPRRPSTVSRRLRGDLEIITLKALEKEPRRRYQSALELEQDLSRHQAGEPVSAVPPSLVYRAGKFIRRNKLGVTAASLLLAIGIVVLVAAWQWSRADAARQERNRMVRELIDFYMVDHFQSISRLANSQEAREHIIEQSLDYLQQLEQDASDDPDLKLVLAEGLQAVGNNHWSMQMGSRGQLEEAIAAWENSRAALDELNTRDPGNQRLLEAGIRTRTLLMDAYRRAGRLDQAREINRQATAMLARLTGTEASLKRSRLELEVLLDQATLAETPESSLEILDQAMTVARRTRSNWPEDKMVQRDVSLLHNRIGSLLLQGGDPAAARDQFEQALAIRLDRLAIDPDANTERRDVLLSHRYIAQCLVALDQRDDAIARYRDQVVPAARSLVELNTTTDGVTDVRATRDLATALRELGELLMQFNRTQDSIPVLQEAMVVSETLASDEPSNITAARDAARCGASLATALISLQRTTDANAILEQVIAALEQLPVTPLPADCQQVLDYCRGLQRQIE